MPRVNSEIHQNSGNGGESSVPPRDDISKTRTFFQWLLARSATIPCICCIGGRKTFFKDRSSLRSDRSSLRRPNAMASQKRAILNRAAGFVGAWALAYLPYIITRINTKNVWMYIVVSMIFPLQGLFNFVVYMSPKVRGAKKRSRRMRAPSGEGLRNEDSEVSWYRAFVKAYMSRGERRRSSLIARRSSAQYSRSHSSASRKSMFQSVLKKLQNYTTTSAYRGRSSECALNTHNVSREKCEIPSPNSAEMQESFCLHNALIENDDEESMYTLPPNHLNTGHASASSLMKDDGDHALRENEEINAFGDDEVYSISEEIQSSIF